jgi:hypothetical protein
MGQVDTKITIEVVVTVDLNLQATSPRREHSHMDVVFSEKHFMGNDSELLHDCPLLTVIRMMNFIGG